MSACVAIGPDYPELKIDVDRTLADNLGISERDVTDTLVTTLSGSFQTAPAFWLSPRTGVSYPIVIQSPQPRTPTASREA